MSNVGWEDKYFTVAYELEDVDFEDKAAMLNKCFTSVRDAENYAIDKCFKPGWFIVSINPTYAMQNYDIILDA